ncbi:hypothetical protein AcV7_007937 [Taiwanofungus camphoratus]|nr:hypothetical protein AcW2_010375 [Antrodia cinnamomea]KAI0952000.1 hypothetical protein AcV7_007937 [Antrodia cinnamomea]
MPVWRSCTIPFPRLSFPLRARLSSHRHLASMAQPTEITVAATGRKIRVPTGLFINNEFVPSVDSKETIECINPATEEIVCSIIAGSEKDIDRAVAAARAAFNTTWGKNVTPIERARLINKLADLIERDAQELAELETLNNGKPVRIARDFDIGDSVGCLRYFAGWADKIVGQTIEVDNKRKLAFTRHDPIGVCGQIIPWNYPINMWSWKVAPALACGCTIVMKPSEITPLTALVRLGLCSSFPTCTIFCLSVTLVPFGCGLHFTRVSSESAKTLHTCRHFLLSFSVTRGYMQCRGCDWPDLSTYVSKWRRH